MRSVTVLRSLVPLTAISGRKSLTAGVQAQAAATPEGGGPNPAVLAFATLQTVPPAPVQVIAARFSYAPGATFTSPALSGPRLGYIETGSFAAHAAGPVIAPQATAPTGGGPATSPATGGDYTLDTDDSITIPAGTSVTFRNTSQATATALVVAVLPSGTALPRTYPAGVTFQRLASGDLQAIPHASALLMLARESLAPGEVTADAGPLLTYVEQGTLSYTLVTGSAAVTTSGGSGTPAAVATPRAAPTGTAINVAAGSAIVEQTGTAGNLKNTGSETASTLVVFLLPALTS